MLFKRTYCKIIGLLSCTLLLAGCGQRGQIERFFTDPQFLQTTLTACTQGQQKGPLCYNAKIAREIILGFTQQASELFSEQEHLMKLQQTLQTTPNDTTLQNEVSEQTAQINNKFINMQEDFAKQIMMAEKELIIRKEMQKQMNAQLKMYSESDLLKKAQLGKDLIDNDTLMQYLKNKINIMLIFVGLSNRVEG